MIFFEFIFSQSIATKYKFKKNSKMEPIRLNHFISQRVNNLHEALSLVQSGNALSFHLRMKASIFIGTIPNNVQIVWHNSNEITMNIFYGGFTFFFYRHQVDCVINSGLLTYRFEIFRLDIDLTFNVFNALLFQHFGIESTMDMIKGKNVQNTSKFNVEEEIRNMLENDLIIAFKNHQYDDFTSDEFLLYKSMVFFQMSDKYQKYGISINQIDTFDADFTT